MNKFIFTSAAVLTLGSCAFNPFVSSHSTNLEAPSLILNDDYALKTAAAASLLTDALTGNTSGTLSAKKNRGLTEEQELAAIDKVHQYLGIMNQILSDQPIQTELVESDREGYDFKSIVTTVGLDGSMSVFTLYFNGVVEDDPITSEETSSELTSSEENTSEESTDSSTETTETNSNDTSVSLEEPNQRILRSDDDEEDDSDEIDDEYELEIDENDDVDDEDRDEYEDYNDLLVGEENEEGDITALRGLAVVGELEYQLIGLTKTETDEVETKYFLWLNEMNWIRIATETEIDEAEYKIVMKVDGNVSKMKFEIEQEVNETEVKLFTQSENNAPEIYQFKSEYHEETGGQLIRIHARVDREKFKAVVLIFEDDNGDIIYNYRFDGSVRDYDRSGHRDYHDRDHRGNGR